MSDYTPTTKDSGFGGRKLTCDHVMPVPVHLGIRLGEIRDVLIRALPLVKDALFVLDKVFGKSQALPVW